MSGQVCYPWARLPKCATSLATPDYLDHLAQAVMADRNLPAFLRPPQGFERMCVALEELNPASPSHSRSHSLQSEQTVAAVNWFALNQKVRCRSAQMRLRC